MGPRVGRFPMAHARGSEVEVKLRRDLGLLEIVMIGFGPTIGSTIFLLIGPGFAIAGPALLLVFGLNFVVTMFTAMAYMELGSAFPETGGGYLWIRRSMRDPWGFLGGWLSWFGHMVVASFYIFGFGLGALTLISYALNISNPTLVIGGLVLDSGALVKVLAVAVAGIFIWLNYRGTKLTGRSETAVTVALILLVCLFIVAGVVHFALGGGVPAQNFQPFFLGNDSAGSLLSILGAMGFTFIVFEGYEIIAQTGEEVRDPEKNIPRAHFIVIGVSTVIFILMAFVAIGLNPTGCPANGLQPCLLSSTPTGDVGNPNAIAELAGLIMPFGVPIIAFGIALGALAALNSLIFSSSRVAFAMGRDGTLPHFLSQLHPKKRTPHVAIALSGAIIITVTLSLDITRVAASADIMFLLLFLLVNWAVIVLRRTMPDVKRYYLIPLFPLIPILGIFTKFILAASLWTIEPQAWLIALGWIALGFVVHYLYQKKEVVVGVTRVVGAVLPTARPHYRILLPVDDLERTELVDFATLVAQVEGGELTLLHVVEVPETLPVDAIDRFYLSEVRWSLGRLRRRAEEAGVTVRARVEVSHRVYEAILDNIRDEDIDLLVTGWKGGWPRARILGSNIDRFVQEAPCDVVVFKAAGMKEKLDRILIMNAPEWHLSYATGYAILLAKKHKAKITILSVVQTEVEAEKEKVYSERLAAMCRTHGVPYEERMIRIRNVVDTVVAEAANYDLLVLGASSEWRLTQFAFGPMQDQIAHKTTTPILMVRKVRRPEAETVPRPAVPAADRSPAQAS